MRSFTVQLCHACSTTNNCQPIPCTGDRKLCIRIPIRLATEIADKGGGETEMDARKLHGCDQVHSLPASTRLIRPVFFRAPTCWPLHGVIWMETPLIGPPELFPANECATDAENLLNVDCHNGGNSIRKLHCGTYKSTAAAMAGLSWPARCTASACRKALEMTHD
jgi:hypothetical protein